MPNINLGNNKDKYKIVHFIISIALGAIVYVLLSDSKPSSRGDGAILVGILRIMFSSFAAGLVAGFFAGKNTARGIGAACLAVIIGFIMYVYIYFGHDLRAAPAISSFLILLLIIPSLIGGAAGASIKKHRVKE